VERSRSPRSNGWWIEPNASKDGAIKQASDLGAYSLWGLTPFLRLEGYATVKLEPMVLADPLFQRMMVRSSSSRARRATNESGRWLSNLSA
jgi:hypothetical protein